MRVPSNEESLDTAEGSVTSFAWARTIQSLLLTVPDFVSAIAPSALHFSFQHLAPSIQCSCRTRLERPRQQRTKSRHLMHIPNGVRKYQAPDDEYARC